MNLWQARKQTLARIRIGRWGHPSLRCHLWGIVQGFAEIADGLVTLLSLGFYMSNIEMQVAYYRGISHHLLNKRAPNDRLPSPGPPE